MDELEFFTKEDKNKVAYSVCVGGLALGGAGIGAATTLGVGTLAGFTVGLSAALYACPHLKEEIKKKLFSSNVRLYDHELVAALRTVKRLRPKFTKDQSLHALAHLRTQVAKNPDQFRIA